MIAKATLCFSFILSTVLPKNSAEVHSKKEHYFGAYIGEFQDRFHGIAGQVKHVFKLVIWIASTITTLASFVCLGMQKLTFYAPD